MIADDDKPFTIQPAAAPVDLALPDDPAMLKALLSQLHATVALQAQRIQDLHQHIDGLTAQHEQRIQGLY